MSTKTTIEWTRNEDGTAGRTWNPVSGCTKVSPGCDHCYAEGIARRFAGSKAFPNGFDVTLHPERLNDPLRWRKPTRVFVNSMSDLFHDDIPTEYIAKVFAVMAATPQHTYQVLTKRPGRMKSLIGDPRYGGGQALLEAAHEKATAEALYDAPWPLPNVWLGVSAEDQHWAEVRINPLLATAAAVRFVSAEPLLGAIDLRNLKARNGALIDCLAGDVKGPNGEVYAACPGSVSWVIAGAESGPGARPMDVEWVRSLRDQCNGGAAFFYKQAAINGKKVPTPKLDGRNWTQMPESVTAR
jgi:protein gp37